MSGLEWVYFVFFLCKINFTFVCQERFKIAHEQYDRLFSFIFVFFVIIRVRLFHLNTGPLGSGSFLLWLCFVYRELLFKIQCVCYIYRLSLGRGGSFRVVSRDALGVVWGRLWELRDGHTVLIRY